MTTVRASRRVKSNVEKLRERLQSEVDEEFLRIALAASNNNLQGALDFIHAQRRGAQAPLLPLSSSSSSSSSSSAAARAARSRAKAARTVLVDDYQDDDGDEDDDDDDEEEEAEVDDEPYGEDEDDEDDDDDDDDQTLDDDSDNNNDINNNNNNNEQSLTDEVVDPSAPSQPLDAPPPSKRARQHHQPRRRALLGDENRNGNATPPLRRKELPDAASAIAVPAADDVVHVAKKKRRRELAPDDAVVVASPPVTDSPAPSRPVPSSLADGAFSIVIDEPVVPPSLPRPLTPPHEERPPDLLGAAVAAPSMIDLSPVVVGSSVEDVVPSVDVPLTPRSGSRVKPAEPCNITCLPEVLLSRLLTLFFESGDVPLATLSLVCRAFRRNLRPWPRFVRINLAPLTAADVAGVRAYAELVVRNTAAPANAVVPRAPPPHPLATLLRDVRLIEFRDGADSGVLGELLVALALLKGASLGHRFDASDAQGEDGLRRRLLVRRDEVCRGCDVAPLCGLALQQCVIDDGALAELAQRAGTFLRSLECVYCAGLQGAAVRALAALQPPAPLYTLQLDHCPALSPRFFANLGRLQSLRHVSFRSNALMGAPELMHEVAKLPHLRTLGLSDALQTDDRSLQVLYEARLTSLRVVDLVGARKVTIDGLWDLLRIDGMTHVNAMWVAPLAADEVCDLCALADRTGVELKCTVEPGHDDVPAEPAEESV